MVQPAAADRNALHELGYKIFLDRYALKDMTRATLAVGDTVIVVVNPKTGQREVGTVEHLTQTEARIKLLDGEVVTRGIENVDKPLETRPEQMMDRVAAGIAQIEATDEKRAEWSEKFRWLLDGWKFVPGGRILTGAGTDQQLTYYNCYVIPSPRDSRGGIMETLSQMTEIMSRGGGVGINISTLRPRHAYVKGVNGRSSGSVSWGALYSFVTGLIEQGGCFGPNERIATDKGLIPAAELADRIDAGEVFFAQTHKGWRQITMRFRNGEKDLYEVVTERGYRVHITAEHKVAVLRGAEVITIPLHDLTVGDEILVLMGEGVNGDYVALKPVEYDRSIMSTKLNTNVTLPENLTEDLAYLIGYSFADGYVHIGKKVNWTAPKALKLATADAHPTIRERLVNIVASKLGLTPTIENGDGAIMNVSIYSRLFIEWLAQNGLLKQKADAIRVPEAIFRSPSSVQLAFIAGYFDADGCNRGKKGGYGIDSISLDGLRDLQQLLAFNGIISRIHTTDRSEQGWQTIYRLNVTGRVFKERFSQRVPAEKVSLDSNGLREENTYPATVWTGLGARAKYRQRIYDGVSDRISPAQLMKIGERLTAAGETALAGQINALLNVMPDPIAAITPVGRAEVYDFQVDDVHLISGNGVYTSNSRRGALMLILNDWHPDVFNFINSKRQAGQITNANISVGVSDALMEAVEADADWDLLFPDTSDADYDTLWDGDIEAWQAAGRKVHVYKTVKAREVWNAIIESAWASAEPGVWFRDRSNKLSNSHYFHKLISTNPCFTGDTRVYTSEGLVKAKDLWNDETDIAVAVDSRFGVQHNLLPATRVFMTGVKPVYKLETVEGYSVRATADHRFMTPSGWVELRDLKPGDRVHILNRKGGFGRHGSLELGRVLGWLVGDGTIKSDRVILSFFGDEKRELAPVFAHYVDTLVAPMVSETAARKTYPVGVVDVTGRDEARIGSTRLRRLVEQYGLTENKLQVPEQVFRGTEEMQRGFLQALFTADGGVQYGKGTLNVRLASSHLPLLQQTQQVLANFGIVSRIYRNRRVGQFRMMPDGKGGQKEYWTEAQHELVISKASAQTFAREIGFMLARKQERLESVISGYVKGLRADKFTVRVESVTPDGEEPVYDLTEPIAHSVTINGIITHNCGEQPLPAFGICNLGAINLSRFYDAENHDVAWEDLASAVRYGVRFLDNVIDSTPYFFEENARVQGAERRVGLGTMGIAELMVKLHIRYGSPESLEFIDRLYYFIAENAYLMSADLAAEKGTFTAFDADKFLESGFMLGMPDHIRETIRQKGMRNVTLLTQAPTGSTGTLVNTSTGIEPFFSWVYYRKSRLGIHEERMPIAQAFFDANPDGENLPDYFVTAMELSPEDHVRAQGAFQRWVDSAISKTCNVPNHYTVEQVSELYKLMYQTGCKGGTIYRDGSRDEQVLMLKGDERAEKEMAEKDSKKTEAPKPEIKVEAPAKPTAVATPHRVYPRPKKLQGMTVTTATPFGTAYVTMNLDEQGMPFEVFITAPGKAGSDLQADAEGLGRLISLSLRTTDPHNRRQMLKLIVEQLRDIGGARAAGFGVNRVTSLPDAVARALEENFLTEITPAQLSLPLAGDSMIEKPKTTSAPITLMDGKPNGNGNGHHAHEASPSAVEPSLLAGADMCPECHTISLIRAEGCRKCMTCGYSEC